jgi:hypothetical protein
MMRIVLVVEVDMNDNTVRQQLNIYLAQGKINFYQLQSIIREVEQNKLMKDLSNQERDLILQTIKK